jgi:hypothetical protein
MYTACTQPWWVLLTRIGPGGHEDLIGVSRTLVDTLGKDTVSCIAYCHIGLYTSEY